MTSKPMCERWYERAGSYRPWHVITQGCTCGTSAHALPERHGDHCPVRQNHVRTELLNQLISGEPER
jgi:hypothetical protein